MRTLRAGKAALLLSDLVELVSGANMVFETAVRGFSDGYEATGGLG